MKNIVILFLILIGINLCRETDSHLITNNDTLNEEEFSLSREKYYEVLIADHMIELILCVSENCSELNRSNCYEQCYEDFKKLKATIDISESVYNDILTDNYHNPKRIEQLKMCVTLKNALRKPIVIKKGVYDDNSVYGFKGKYGPRGEKGPYGPYGEKGPYRKHNHIYNKERRRIEIRKQRRLLDPLIELSTICEYLFEFFGFDTTNCED